MTQTYRSGTDHDDELTGGDDEDFFDGRAGADVMIGGKGDDWYVVKNPGDVVIEKPGEGADTVVSRITEYNLPANVEMLALQGDAIIGRGNDLDNSIWGTNGNNLIDGLAGADTMRGSDGNDHYWVDNPGDVVIELAGQGTADRVVSRLHEYNLPANVEELSMEDNAFIGRGNDLDNRIWGTAGDNLIDGLGGADTMTGGDGNDHYWIDNPGDVVIEYASGGRFDRVVSRISEYTLAANVEELWMEGGAYIGRGNDLDNSIWGTDGDNQIDGLAGADTMIGGGGNDTYWIDNPGDVVLETARQGTADRVVSRIIEYTLAANVEELWMENSAFIGRGNNLNNRIWGTAGDNRIDGLGGADTMMGGGGNDHYWVDNPGDVVIENAGEGTADRVVSRVYEYTLAANVEDLSMEGNAFFGVGNDLDNTIWGTAGSNRIDGLGGADTMAGGDGNDWYYVDNLGDVVIEKAGEGVDRVMSPLSVYNLGADVEELSMGGDAFIGRGNDLNNLIYGTAGDNLIDGLGGADTMVGFGGNDHYWVDNPGDVVLETASQGTADRVVSRIFEYTLAANVEQLWMEGGAYIGRGNDLDNTIWGTADNDRIDGQAGADTMVGFAGNDRYWVDNLGDVVLETAGQGTADRVVSRIYEYTLAANVEELFMEGDAFIGRGNDLGNVLMGNAGDNELYGGAGDDWLYGMRGNNQLNGGDGNDYLYGGDSRNSLRGESGDDVYVIDGGVPAAPSLAELMHDAAAEGRAIAMTAPVVSSTTMAVTATGNQDIDALLYSDRWASTTVSYSFPTSASQYGSGYGPEAATFQALNAQQQDAVKSVLAQYAAVSNLSFTLDTVTPDAASIRFGNTQSGGVDADAYTHRWQTSSWVLLDVWFTSAHVSGSPVMGNHSWDAILHEIGHTLRLGHGHEVEPISLTNQTMTMPHDSKEFSVMTYRGYVGEPINPLINIPNNYFRPQTPMMYDIAAIQHLYGADFSTNAADSRYTFSPSTGEMSINGVGQGAPGGNFIFRTIWDGGGSDTYDFSNYTTDQTISLAPGGWSMMSTQQLANLDTRSSNHYAQGNVYNALQYHGDPRSLIENAVGGSGNDTITGNAANNKLDGGTGADTMAGGAGDDHYWVDNPGDVVIELAGEGTADRVTSRIQEYNLAANVEELWMEGGAYIGRGNDLDNTIRGTAGDNRIDGLAGADTMTGGDGNDHYWIDNPGDVVLETAGQGTADIVVSRIHEYNLAANVEGLSMEDNAYIGRGNDLDNTIWGTAGDNLIFGLGGHDVLFGREGMDTLLGGLGDDTLWGGPGSDTYLFTRGGGADRIIEVDAGNIDVLQFQGGISADQGNISADQIWLRHIGNDLELSVIGTSDNITILNWYAGDQYHVERFKSSDGRTLVEDSVDRLVQAMAGFAPPGAGQTTLLPSYAAVLAPVIAASWF